jgi:hypothetical protein
MIIALTNSKGGVGKSTLAAHLAVWWQEQNAKVALVDADAKSSSSVWLHEAAADLPVCVCPDQPHCGGSARTELGAGRSGGATHPPGG